MSSTSGTISRTRKKVKVDEAIFTAKELCEIIRAAKSTNLKVMRYRGLELEFGLTLSDYADEFHVEPPRQIPGTPEVEPTPEQKELLEELALDQLAIDDPTAYEKQLIDTQLGEE